jgi:hypothetical protein
MSEHRFDKVLKDIPFNGTFATKDGFVGVKSHRMQLWGGEEGFICRALAERVACVIAANTEVCEVVERRTYDHITHAYLAVANDDDVV